MKFKSTTTLFIPYFLFLSVFSKADTIYVESKIESVTVYYQGAEVNRKAEISLSKGQHVLIFDELPYEIAEDEYQIKSSHPEGIVSIKLNKQRGRLKGKSKQTKLFEEKIETLIDESKDIEGKAFILDQKKKILLSNSQIHASNEGVNLVQLEKALQYFDDKLNAIREERVLLKERLDTIQKEILELNKQIQDSVRKTNENYAQVMVYVDSKQDEEMSFVLGYYVVSAGWKPNYNLKVEQINQPLTLEFQAQVFQTTGEHWDNVHLKLNDSRPLKSTDFPKFKSWYLEDTRKVKKEMVYYTSIEGVVGNSNTGDILPFSEVEILKGNKPYKRVVTDKYGAFKVHPIPAGPYTIIIKNAGFSTVTKSVELPKFERYVFEIGLKEQVEGLVITKADIAAKPVRGVAGLRAQTAGIAQADQGSALSVRGGRSTQTVYFVDGVKVLGNPGPIDRVTEIIHINNQINENQLNSQYELEAPHQILSNGEEYTLRIKTIEIPVTYEHVVFAKEDQHAYLKGNLVKLNAYNLFTGKANIYFKGAYVGQTILDVRNLSDTTALFLGIDNDVVVERTKHVKIHENQFNNKVKSDLDITVSVKNNKQQPINLVVIEQYPITKHKEVLIAILEAEGAENDKRIGKLKWKLNMNANQKQMFNYKYVTKHFKTIVVN